MRENLTDGAVLSSTAVILTAVRRQTGLAYADDHWSPVADLTLEMIAHRLGAELGHAHLAAGVQEIGIPGYVGSPLIIVNRGIPAPYRSLALRHGLAHLVAGELEPGQGSDIRFMSNAQDWTSLEERRADLFALADLIPDRGLRKDPDWIARAIVAYAPDWPMARLRDRVDLRLRLARLTGEGAA